MGKPPGPVITEFGAFLLKAIHDAGYDTPTALARVAGLNPSVLVRMAYGETKPKVTTLQRLAPLLGLSETELVAKAYPDGAWVDLPPRMHPLAVELSMMLDDDSPLSDEQRQKLRDFADHMLEPLRRNMRRGRRRA